MKLHLGFLIALPLALGACAETTANNSGTASGPQSTPAKTGGGQPQTTDCINLISLDHTEVVNDQTILFYMVGGKVWKNTLPYKCPGLGFEGAFGYETAIDQLCSVDTITVLDTDGGMPGATCGLGKFEAYTPPPKASKKADKTQ